MSIEEIRGFAEYFIVTIISVKTFLLLGTTICYLLMKVMFLSNQQRNKIIRDVSKVYFIGFEQFV